MQLFQIKQIGKMNTLNSDIILAELWYLNAVI